MFRRPAVKDCGVGSPTSHLGQLTWGLLKVPCRVAWGGSLGCGGRPAASTSACPEVKVGTSLTGASANYLGTMLRV